MQAPLANQNTSRAHEITAMRFDPQALTVAIPTVPGGTARFMLTHEIPLLTMLE
jgi:hypothetical protein